MATHTLRDLLYDLDYELMRFLAVIPDLFSRHYSYIEAKVEAYWLASEPLSTFDESDVGELFENGYIGFYWLLFALYLALSISHEGWGFIAGAGVCVAIAVYYIHRGGRDGLILLQFLCFLLTASIRVMNDDLLGFYYSDMAFLVWFFAPPVLAYWVVKKKYESV